MIAERVRCWLLRRLFPCPDHECEFVPLGPLPFWHHRFTADVPVQCKRAGCGRLATAHFS